MLCNGSLFMVIKIAVCDDDLSVLRQIKLYLILLQDVSALQLQVVFFSSAEELINTIPRDIDVLLLDIHMENETGISAARKLRKEGLDFYLIFITSHVQYALEGYEVHAFAFLQKPLRFAPFKTHLTEIISRLEQAKPFTLTIRSGNETALIDCSRIIYIEVYGHKTNIVLDNGQMSATIPINDLESQLSKHGFFRCHKSYLVNLCQVSGFDTNQITVSNHDKIPLSRHRKQEFLLTLHSVIGR